MTPKLAFSMSLADITISLQDSTLSTESRLVLEKEIIRRVEKRKHAGKTIGPKYLKAMAS